MIKLNGTPITPTIFPDKTSQVWKLAENLLKGSIGALIEWQYENEGELLQVAQLKDLLDKEQYKAVNLLLSYLPYARQDKEVSNATTFALHSFARLLNALNFAEVIIIDPHSTVSLELINNSRAIYPQKQVEAAINAVGAELIIYPDKGAKDKYRHNLNLTISSIYGTKNRNPKTGVIEEYYLSTFFDDQKPKGKRVLIVDDICDGGATFIALAKELKKAEALTAALYVTHGLFTKGTQILRDAGINRIFTYQGEINA